MIPQKWGVVRANHLVQYVGQHMLIFSFRSTDATILMHPNSQHLEEAAVAVVSCSGRRHLAKFRANLRANSRSWTIIHCSYSSVGVAFAWPLDWVVEVLKWSILALHLNLPGLRQPPYSPILVSSFLQLISSFCFHGGNPGTFRFGLQ